MDPHDLAQVEAARRSLREAHRLLDVLNKKYGTAKDVMVPGNKLHLATTQVFLAGVNLDQFAHAVKAKA